MHRVLQFATSLLLAIWWGGLTFYAAIVVPAGTDAFGSTEQGFVTQAVSVWLNGILGLALLVAGRRLIVIRRPLEISAWGVLLTTLVFLIALHWQLDRMLDPLTMSVNHTTQFYTVHRIYLWVTSVQWLTGMVWFWCLMFPRGPVPADDGTSDAMTI